MTSRLEISQGGDLRWYDEDGKLHREGGPAIIHYDGWEAWYWHGKIHRADGPAATWPDGHSVWWYHGKQILCQSQEEFERLLKLKAFW